MEHDTLIELLEQEECLTADGFDGALIGISCGVNPVAVYDVNEMLTILVKRDRMTFEDAKEYLDFNVIGAYVGEKTPLYIDLDRVRACAFRQDY